MRRKLTCVGIFVVSGSLFAFIGEMFQRSYESDWIRLLCTLAVLTGAILVIVGVCSFASAMHDPLTPNEAAELVQKDAIEKGGKQE